MGHGGVLRTKLGLSLEMARIPVLSQLESASIGMILIKEISLPSELLELPPMMWVIVHRY